ncbi:MAG: hypothetical protein V4590_01510 [Bacteroidota bacterium]
MAEITRNRTIRPSTRLETSVNYRVHINGITANDTLIVNITHESKPFARTFSFRGKDVLQKKSLGFKVHENGKQISINWISTQPHHG